MVTAFVAAGQTQTPEDDRLKRVEKEMQFGSNEKAIAAVTELIKKKPTQADNYRLRSSLRMMSGDSYGALADINKVIQLKPEMGQAYHERAIIRVMTNDLKGALRDLDSAILHDFKVDSIYLMRAQLRANLGDLKGALADLDETMKLNPNNPQVYANRGAVLLTLEDYDKALEDLNYLLNWYETDPNKRINSKAVPSPTPDEKKYNDPAIVGMVIQTVNAAPGDKEMVPVIASAYLNRGSINSRRGNVDAAISDFTKSIRLDSTKLKAFHARALEWEARGDWDAALADVSRAIQLDPMNGNLRVEHGVIQQIMGNPKGAQADFDIVLNTDRALWQKRIDDRLAEVKKKTKPE